MDAFRIEGGARLSGRIRIDGSKNAALPQMAAALLTDESVTLHGVPPLSDIANMVRLLGELGCEAVSECSAASPLPGIPSPQAVPAAAGLTWGGARSSHLSLRSRCTARNHARYEIVRTMRASICVLGPLLARRGFARISMPGGCAFGPRPVDLHLRGLRALGATIELDGGDIVATAPGGAPGGGSEGGSGGGSGGRLRGATIFLGGPFGSTVLGTANVMCAATLAEGRTIIESAACEPEVVDLAQMLTSMGAKIAGAGSPRITIEGVEQLGGCEHTVIPDRIVAGTYAIAAAMTNGDVILDDFPCDSLLAVMDRLSASGVHIEPISNDQTSTGSANRTVTVRRPTAPQEATGARSRKQRNGDPRQDGPGHGRSVPSDSLDVSTFRRLDVSSVRVTCERHLRPVVFTTQPYPGFPTDLQAQMMALLCLADGNSVVTEKIYPERFMHVAELTRMGAALLREGPTVVVQGVRRLVGAPVMASDLRGSACLVLAGLAAEGETTVSRVYHIDRGYVRMEQVLQRLGAKIERVDPDDHSAEDAAATLKIPAAAASV